MRELQKIRLRIPLKLPYKNTLTPSYGNRAFFCYKAMQREWNGAIPEALPDQRADGPRLLRIVRVMEPREMEFDTGNVYYVAAWIIDIVKRRGYLVDDTPRLCKLAEPVQRLAVGDETAPATYIEIEDLPGPAVRTARLPGL